jgi:dTDP-4-dehydrorhamnose reductase
MSWLITGGSGQLGIALSQELTARGILFEAWSSKELNITQEHAVRNSISKLSPKVIINCAAWTDVDGAEKNEFLASKVNSLGAENIALAAKMCNSKLIQISTDYVFSGNSNGPWAVEAQVNPRSTYGRTKAEGESRVISAYPENTSIVRTAWLYSPWGKNFAKTMTNFALRSKGQVRVVNNQVGQPTSAIELAKLVVELSQSDSPSGIYHGTNAGQATWFEFAQMIFKFVGASTDRVIPALANEFPRPAERPAYSVLSHNSWAKTSVEPMRDWRIALSEVMPAIISAVQKEE